MSLIDRLKKAFNKADEATLEKLSAGTAIYKDILNTTADNGSSVSNQNISRDFEEWTIIRISQAIEPSSGQVNGPM